MTSYAGLYEFTDEGMTKFQQIFNGVLDEDMLAAIDPANATRISGTNGFDAHKFGTAKEMAQAIIKSCGTISVRELLARDRVWAWLSFVLRDQLYPEMPDGRRKLGEIHRWYPAPLNDFRKGQRHLVRMPVLLLNTLDANADHLLCGDPAIPGEVREQLTSQQDMFHPTFQAVARTLYFDDRTGKLRRSAGGKNRGSSRHLARVRQQLDVTWDLFAIKPEELLEKLPPEFDRFRAIASA